jgi:hypothetical protein
MEWLRLDAAYPTHKKTLRLIRRHGKDGAWGHVCILAYCATHDTGGVIDDDVLASLGVSAEWYTGDYDAGGGGLLTGVGDGRYMVHGWGDRNPSRGEREAFVVEREARRAAGARRAKAYRERKAGPEIVTRDDVVTPRDASRVTPRDAGVTQHEETPANNGIPVGVACDVGVTGGVTPRDASSRAPARAFTDGTDAQRTSVPDDTRDPTNPVSVDWSLAGEVVQAARERLNVNGDQRRPQGEP